MSVEKNQQRKYLESIINEVMDNYLRISQADMSFVELKNLVNELVSEYNSKINTELDEQQFDETFLSDDMFLTYTTIEGGKPVTRYKKDKVEPPKPPALKKIDVLIVYGCILNIICDVYIKNIGKNNTKKNKILNIIIRLSQIKDIGNYVQYPFVWKFPIFIKIINLINSEYVKTRDIAQNLFYILVNNVKKTKGEFPLFYELDVSMSLWLETDNFQKYYTPNKNKEKKEKMKRFFYLLRAGANPIEPRVNYKLPSVSEHLRKNKYLTLYNLIPILFFETFNETNKENEVDFENGVNIFMKKYTTVKLIDELSLDLLEAAKLGYISESNTLLFARIIQMTGVPKIKTLGYGNINGFGYADEYDSEYDSEFGSDEGSYDDAYGFGASADDYDDDDDDDY